MADLKTKFTNPAKPGEDQGTTFLHTKTEDALSECPKTRTTSEHVTRGENNFAKYPRAV